jgi:hypothetical protein
VSVTHTGPDALAGHKAAMQKAEAGHKELKKYEELKRVLERRANTMPAEKEERAAHLAARIDQLYTDEDATGQSVLRSRDGTLPDDIRDEAIDLLGADAVLDILGKRKDQP